MAITNYTELKAAVASWLHRTGDADLTAAIPDLITLAEESISRDLIDCPAMWVTEPGISLAQGASSITLAGDLIGIRTLTVTSPFVRDVRVGSISQMLRSTPTDATVTGPPQVAALAGNNGSAGTTQVTIYPTADRSYTLRALCSAPVDALSGSVASNFVLARSPSIYLFGALREAAPWLQDDERIAVWSGKYAAAVDAFLALPWAGEMPITTEVAGLYGAGGFNITTG